MSQGRLADNAHINTEQKNTKGEKMKNQNFGLSTHSIPYPAHPHDVEWIGRTVLREEACHNYYRERRNGVEADNTTPFPQDGTYSWEWETPSEAYSNTYARIRYTAGPRDRAWMEERDRNYLARLEREALRQQEPEEWKRLHPDEYQQGQEEKENQENDDDEKRDECPRQGHSFS